jgi:phosphate transport system permease protein
MLGLGRALGETMAVTFVVGNAHSVSAHTRLRHHDLGHLYTSSLIALV